MEKADLPPPYEHAGAPIMEQPAYAPQPGYPPQQPGYAPQQAGYAPVPGYPPTSQPNYPPTSQPGYPPTSQPYYPPTSQQGYPPASKPGYPPSGPHPGYGPPPVVSQQHTSNTTVIMAGAPQPTVIQQQVDIPPNYMALSWLVCLFCCWPLGLAAIIASSRVDTAVAAGNYIYARHQSNRAKSLAIASIFCGIAIYVIIVIRFTVLATTYSSNSYN